MGNLQTQTILFSATGTQTIFFSDNGFANNFFFLRNAMLYYEEFCVTTL